MHLLAFLQSNCSFFQFAKKKLLSAKFMLFSKRKILILLISGLTFSLLGRHLGLDLPNVK